MRKTYSKKAIKAIEKLDKHEKQRIKKAIEGLPKGNIVKLQGYEKLHRLRVGDRRVTFSYIEKDKILIESVEPRGDAY